MVLIDRGKEKNEILFTMEVLASQLEPSELYLSHWSLINGPRRLRVQTTLCKMGFIN